VQTSNWYSNYLTKDQKSQHMAFKLPIEFINFDNTISNALYDNYELINEYLILDDQKKKEDAFSKINTQLGDQIINYVYSLAFLIKIANTN
jgi:hypothetical protein